VLHRNYYHTIRRAIGHVADITVLDLDRQWKLTPELWHPKVQTLRSSDATSKVEHSQRSWRESNEYTVMSKGLLILGSNGKEEVLKESFSVLS